MTYISNWVLILHFTLFVAFKISRDKASLPTSSLMLLESLTSLFRLAPLAPVRDQRGIPPHWLTVGCR